MKGYKVPQHMIEGRKNWIAQYQKDEKYVWGMNEVIEDIESLPPEELDDNWHTGTPTEDGWYLIAYKPYNRDGIGYGHQVLEYANGSWYEADGTYIEPYIVAWQKIEPYEASN